MFPVRQIMLKGCLPFGSIRDYEQTRSLGVRTVLMPFQYVWAVEYDVVTKTIK